MNGAAISPGAGPTIKRSRLPVPYLARPLRQGNGHAALVRAAAPLLGNRGRIEGFHTPRAAYERMPR